MVGALSEWSDDESAELFVVSGDDLFVKACNESDGLHPVTDLTALLDLVASDDKKLSNFFREEIKKRLDVIKKEVASKFQDLGFHVDDEWGDVEIADAELTDPPSGFGISTSTNAGYPWK